VNAKHDTTLLAVNDLGKAYARQDIPWARLRSLLVGEIPTNDHWALRGVSFSLRRGQCLGIVGDNGAGKSTLLKLIAGALRPTTGTLRREGWLTAILELGAGFHPDFTGRQNLYFGGALIGIAQERMRQLEPEIIAFAELDEALDRPVKTYSSGMTVRLAFALVTAIEPAILIIDEALAVGDQHFQRKCVERIETFRRNGCIVLFCSHSLYHVRQLCDQTLWLDNGHMRAIGPTEEVLTRYETHVRNLNAADPSAPTPVGAPATARLPRSGDVTKLVSVEVAGLGDGEPPLLVSPDLSVTVTAYAAGAERPNLAVMIERADKVCVTAVGTHADGVVAESLGEGMWRATVTFPNLPLYSGEYLVSAYLFDARGTLVYEQWLDCQRFMVVFQTLEVGLVRLPHTWA
jgi:lipopolysaccharide transport system ATP-binding protein